MQTECPYGEQVFNNSTQLNFIFFTVVFINGPNRTHFCRHTALSEISNKIVGVEITIHYQSYYHLICTIFLPTWVYKSCCLVYKTSRCRGRMTPSGGRKCGLHRKQIGFLTTRSKTYICTMSIFFSMCQCYAPDVFYVYGVTWYYWSVLCTASGNSWHFCIHT